VLDAIPSPALTVSDTNHTIKIIIHLFIIYLWSQELNEHLHKQHNVDTKTILQRKESKKTTDKRPVYEIAQRKITIPILHDEEKRKDNKNKKSNTNKQEKSYEETNKMIIVISII
jgi:uncharacterized membrane protein